MQNLENNGGKLACNMQFEGSLQLRHKQLLITNINLQSILFFELYFFSIAHAPSHIGQGNCPKKTAVHKIKKKFKWTSYFLDEEPKLRFVFSSKRATHIKECMFDANYYQGRDKLFVATSSKMDTSTVLF